MKRYLFSLPLLLLLQAVLALPLHADGPIAKMGAYPLSLINSDRIAQGFVIDIVERVASDIGEPTLSEWTKYAFAVTCGLLLLLGIGIIVLRAHIRLRMRVLAEKVIEQKQIEETLRASEERFRFLTENMADIVWTLDKDFRTTYVSPSVKVLGFTPEERKLQTLEEMITPDSLQRAMSLLLEELERDKEQDTDPERYVTIEVEYYHADGHTVWMENNIKALRDETGAIVGMYGSSRDITERKQAEAALQESEERLRNIVEHSTNLFYSHTPDHVLTYLSPQTERLLGYKPEEALVKWTELATDNPVNKRGLEITQRAIDTGQRQPPYELELVGKDGRKIWVEISEAPVVRDGKTVVIVGAANDVTERKRAEAELRLERDRAQEYLNIVGVILVAVDERGEITLMNRQGCRILGYAEGELVGKNWFEACLPARMRESIAAFFEKLMAKEVEPVEHYENPVLTKSGEERLIAWHNTVMMDETGKVVGTLSSGEDITERRRMEEELRQHERLAAVGQLAGGIAHDFNNLLTTIMLYAQMGLGQPNLPPNLTRSFETILDESRKAAELVQQILDFSRRAMIEVRPLDLKSFTEEVATILQRTIPESIHLTVQTGQGEYVVKADPTRIQQALMNLATNARDAMTLSSPRPEGSVESPEVKELRFELSRVRVGPGKAGPVAGMEPGAWVCLTVSDTGMGITEEVRSHLFEPFFTTKPARKGTGLGLAQVYGIVRQHGGYIGVETEVGKGTTFRIYLPASESEGKEEIEETAMDIPPGQGETILLVEDKGELREAGQEILQSLGYLVLVAANGREALEIYQSAEQVDLVITDLVMPEMGGRELMQELWKTTPTLKGLAITGYIIEEEARELKETGLLDVVYKPFEMDTMARIIRRVLDED